MAASVSRSAASAKRRDGQRGLLGVELPHAVPQRVARADVDPLVCGERGAERREREEEEGRHPPHAFPSERDERRGGLPEGPEHSAEAEGVQHGREQCERERRGADAAHPGKLRPPDAVDREEARRDLGKVAEKVRVLAAHGFPPAVVGVRDHAIGGGGAVEEGVEGVRDRQDERRREQQLDEPQRHGEVRLRQRQAQPPQEAGERARSAATAHRPAPLTRAPS